MSELTDDRLREIIAAYRPAECDPDNCDDPFCPYMHYASYLDGNADAYFMARELLALRAAASTSTEAVGVIDRPNGLNEAQQLVWDAIGARIDEAPTSGIGATGEFSGALQRQQLSYKSGLIAARLPAVNALTPPTPKVTT